MSDSGAFKLGEVARAVVAGGEPLDWKLLFEEEHRHRMRLEGELSRELKRVRNMAGASADMERHAMKVGKLNDRIDDMRRGIAARLMAAMVIKSGMPQADDLFDFAGQAVDSADELIAALLATKAGPRR